MEDDLPIQRLRQLGRPGLFAAALMTGLFAPVLVQANSADDPAVRLDRLEFRASQISEALSSLTGPGTPFAQLPPATIGDNRVQMAQSQTEAQVNLRLSQMEEQMRTLTGQVEGLQFQMTQLQTAMERLQEDIDFRFQQLEGSASGKTDAASPAGGAMPSGGAPQTQNPSDARLPADEQAQPLELSETGPASSDADGTDQARLQATTPGGAPLDLGPPLDADSGSRADFSVFEPGEMDAFSTGLQQDSPMLGEGGETGSSVNLNLESGGISANLGDPSRDLDFESGDLVSEADAEAQYRAGYDAVVNGDYEFAEAQFRQFVALFPQHPQAPDATNWLGEALIQRGDHDEAAQILFEGFQRYEQSARAPDLLLKLGIALAGAGEQATACRTFTEVLNRYPGTGAAFQSRVTRERAAAQC